MNPIIKSFQYGQHTVTLETGVIARQADAAVLASMGDTTVLVTVVGKKNDDVVRDFFPLTVNYQERTYAAGKIPGGFFKREGRPSENETLVSRLIDRPIRPLFADGYTNEVQIIATVVSVDQQINPDIVSLIGASAALSISGLPFNGPLGAARVGYIDDKYCINPTVNELKESKLDLVVSGTKNAVLMVESEAAALSEEIMLGAVVYGHEQQQVVIDAIHELKALVNPVMRDWVAPLKNQELEAKIAELGADGFTQAYQIVTKAERYEQVKIIKKHVIEQLIAADSEVNTKEAEELLGQLEKKIVRARILEGKPRIDGREPDMVRALSVVAGVLPRTHGSALFTRGETQALVVCTLGTERDAQKLESVMGEEVSKFMLHYNFPPYSVGETGMVGSPKRREIGHGKLAWRGMKAVMPTSDEFPYSIRVVSEITESNGSSSMASVCGTSLALMDAGVPIKSSVAGIAMGLVKEGDRFVVLSDILGDEDHLGDMDFKVAGTKDGVTALQMDIKIEGITAEIMKVALSQAYGARRHILQVMDQVISSNREEISDFAPRITVVKINPEKIREVIGKGGATIRQLTEETGTTIELEDDGTVKIASNNVDQTAEVLRRINEICAEVEVGKVYVGKVIRIVDFGAFVTILPGKDGLVHISQISDERVAKVEDHLTLGQEVTVKVMEIDRQGRVRLSMKEAKVEV